MGPPRALADDSWDRLALTPDVQRTLPPLAELARHLNREQAAMLTLLADGKPQPAAALARAVAQAGRTSPPMRNRTRTTSRPAPR